MPDADLKRLADDLAELRRTVTETMTNDQVKERAFDQLYSELRQYKDDFLFQAEKPLLLDLLLFYDSLQWFHESLIKQEMSPDVIADSFQYLLDELLEVLYRRDVLPVEETESFDRRIHKAVKVAPIEDAALDNTVAQVLKRGFQRADRLLRAEEVVINRLSGAGKPE